MEIRLQTHFHTIHSKRTIPTDSTISEEVARKYGFFKDVVDAFVKTDHHTTEGTEHWKKMGNKYGVTVISGIEIDCREGHLAGIGIDEGITTDIHKDMPVELACKIIKKYNGLPFIVHPFAPHYGLGPEILKGKNIDGIVEIHNSLLQFPELDTYAHKLAKRMDAVKVVGADAHCPEMVGLNITVVDADNKSEKSIIEALKERRIILYDNVGIFPAENIKKSVLEKVRLSQNELRGKIKYGWPADKKYMMLANSPFIKPLEYALLDYGVKNKESKLWDILTILFYVGLNFKKEYNIHIKDRKIYKMLDSIDLSS